MNEWYMVALTALLGGGLFTALINFLKYMRERRQNVEDAQAAGITAPAEAESITIKSMSLAIESLSKENERINKRLTDGERERREDQEHTHRELQGLRKALQAAHDYIEALLAWGRRVAPDEAPPPAPPDYRNI